MQLLLSLGAIHYYVMGKKLILFSKLGFTLIEVLVVTAIVGILSVAMASVLEFTFRSQYNTNLNSGISDIGNDLRSALSVPKVCALNFNNFLNNANLLSPDPSTIPTVLSKNPSDGTSPGIIVQVTTTANPVHLVNFSKASVTSVGVQNIVDLTAAGKIDLGGSLGLGKKYQMDLVVTIAKGAGYIGSANVVKRFSMTALKPDTGAPSCFVGSETIDVNKIISDITEQVKEQVAPKLCTEIGGVFNPVNQTCKPKLTDQTCKDLGLSYANGKCSLSKKSICEGAGGTFVNNVCRIAVTPAAGTMLFPPPEAPTEVDADRHLVRPKCPEGTQAILAVTSSTISGPSYSYPSGGGSVPVWTFVGCRQN